MRADYADPVIQVFETNLSHGPRAWVRVDYLGYEVSRDFALTDSLEDLLAWVADPLSDGGTNVSNPKTFIDHSAKRIAFCNADGKLILLHGHGEGGQIAASYDPSSEEQLAKLVRYLQRVAQQNDPAYAKSPSLPIELPDVTASDLRHKRTIYTNASAAHGVRKPRKRKPGDRPTLNTNAANKKLTDIIGLLALSASKKDSPDA